MAKWVTIDEEKWIQRGGEFLTSRRKYRSRKCGDIDGGFQRKKA